MGLASLLRKYVDNYYQQQYVSKVIHAIKPKKLLKINMMG